MAGRFRPADHAKGDANTIGGYAAVHDRPAAFEGSDGCSYSVEIIAQPGDGPGDEWGAFFFFVRWARLGAQSPDGHLESVFVTRGPSEAVARERIGALALADVREILDELIQERDRATPRRAWWDAMQDAVGE